MSTVQNTRPTTSQRPIEVSANGDGPYMVRTNPSRLAPRTETLTVGPMLLFIGKLGLAALSGVIILALL